MKGESLCSAVDGVDQSRDEYPYKTTKEGGFYQLRKARVECVPVPEQFAQGRYLNTFYQNELGYQNDAPFYVFPVPY